MRAKRLHEAQFMDWDMTKKSLEATLTDTMEKLITGK